MPATQPALGAPGVYAAAAPPRRALAGARMDVCAFVGVAPRGPCRVPYTDDEWIEAGAAVGSVSELSCVDRARPRRRSVAVRVESWDDYRRLYGGFEGPGRLPYAVASFFEQGGQRAYVVRVVHEYPDPGRNRRAVASGPMRRLRHAGGGSVWLHARNEGAWGNALRATLSFATRPLPFLGATASTLTVRPGQPVAPGTLVRLGVGGIAVLRFVRDVRAQLAVPPDRDRSLLATLELAAPAAPVSAEIVEGTLEIDDGDGRYERHERLGLSPVHVRWLARVLCDESELVYPGPKWAESEVLPVDPDLPSATSRPFHGGYDRYRDIVPEDFFDARWVLGDEGPADGVQAVLEAEEVATLVVPDLYEPSPLSEPHDVVDPPTVAGPAFQPCVPLVPAPHQTVSPDPLLGLLLDPSSDLALIVGHQRRLVELAELTRAFVVLLDVPPGLDQRRILFWRGQFDSSYAAAYHPWLEVVRTDDLRRTKQLVNPSAFAAGIVAQRELAYGVPYGPSNTLAARVVDVADRVSPQRHDELHPLGIDVFLRERDGILLTAARTLSRDPAYRQLSVRRLMMMLARTLERELQWVVFEPNDESLRADLRHLLRSYLRRLYRGNAFEGATEDDAFFVRCDETTNPQWVIDAGQLVTEIGVAPVEPLEFLVVRLTREGDGTLLVESPRG